MPFIILPCLRQLTSPPSSCCWVARSVWSCDVDVMWRKPQRFLFRFRTQRKNAAIHLTESKRLTRRIRASLCGKVIHVGKTFNVWRSVSLTKLLPYSMHCLKQQRCWGFAFHASTLARSISTFWLYWCHYMLCEFSRMKLYVSQSLMCAVVVI